MNSLSLRSIKESILLHRIQIESNQFRRRFAVVNYENVAHCTFAVELHNRANELESSVLLVGVYLNFVPSIADANVLAIE